MKARCQYQLKCLANRVAGYENTKKRFTINWKYARIEEDKDSPIQDMDYLINNTISPSNNPTGRGGMASPEAFVGATMQATENPSPTIKQTSNKDVSEPKITGNDLF